MKEETPQQKWNQYFNPFPEKTKKLSYASENENELLNQKTKILQESGVWDINKEYQNLNDRLFENGDHELLKLSEKEREVFAFSKTPEGQCFRYYYQPRCVA